MFGVQLQAFAIGQRLGDRLGPIGGIHQVALAVGQNTVPPTSTTCVVIPG